MKNLIQFTAVAYFGFATVSFAQGIDPAKKGELDRQTIDLQANTLKKDVELKDALLVESLKSQLQELNRLNAELTRLAQSNAVIDNQIQMSKEAIDAIFAEQRKLNAVSAPDSTNVSAPAKP